MSNLPSNWVSIGLLDISTLVRGVTYTKADARDLAFDGSIPVLRANNIQDHAFHLQDLVHVPASLVSSMQRIRKGDVVVATSSGSISVVGKAAQASSDMDAGFGAFCGLLRPNDEINARYFGHYFSSNAYRTAVSTMARGVNINNLKRDHFDALILPLAPLPEQKRIADKLDAVLARVDACRNRLDRIPAILKRFRQSVLAAATSGKLTADWRVSEKGCKKWELCSVGSLINLNPKTDAQNNVCVGFVPMPLMGTGYLEIPAFEERLWGAVKKGYTHFQDGDVLLAKITPCFENGKAGIMAGLPNGIGAGSTEYFVCRVIDSNKLLPKFLLAFFKTESFMKQGELEMTGSVGHKRVPKQYIQNSEINLPSLAEQHEIVRRVEALFAFADRLEARHTAARAQIEKLTPATLAKAFRGELVPQDPNDEPASKLLERIRANSTSMPTKSGGRKQNNKEQVS